MRKIGYIYEEKAMVYLQELGYKILGRNIYINHREVDILCEKDDTTILVEVKYRHKLCNWDFFPHLTKKQKQNLMEAAQLLVSNPIYHLRPLWQIDFLYFSKTHIKHFTNILRDIM